jgi:HlyD family secretion protein
MITSRIRRTLPAVVWACLTAIGCAEEVEPPVYQMVPVVVRDIVVSASAAGIIEPVKTVEVKSKASGEIMDVRVETGDRVGRGDLLVSVDPRVPRNALTQAEADLEVAKAQLTNAQSQLRRAEALYETQSITEQEWEAANLQQANANAQLVRAERSFEDARISFEDTEVRAATAGVILQKNVEVGTVISSATREVGGGTVLLAMANLDTVQVRSLVDETDIGKIRAGLEVTIVVDAYPNQPFRGRVLKIEPQAEVQQNVTMFPVLSHIGNEDALLRPGMNAEVEIHVGAREGIVAIPNAALRTQRDVSSAATVLGLDMETVQMQLAAARERTPEQQSATFGASTAGNGGSGQSSNTVTFRGQEVPLPPGLTKEQVEPVIQKLQSGGPGAFQSLSAADRAILGRLRGGMGGPGGGGQHGPSRQSSDFAFGGEFIVFTIRDGAPQAVPIRTGLTDLDYSEVVAGLTEQDTVLILPSASLIQSQQELQQRIERMTGRGIPGVQRRGSD